MQKTPVCGSDYMENTLKYFSVEEIEEWCNEAKKIDKVLHNDIFSNLKSFDDNNHNITPELAERFIQILKENNTETNWDINLMEAFYGYTVYTYTDNAKKKTEAGNKDLYYGIAKATSYGANHIHYLTDSFNRVVDGEGIFIGLDEDMGKFRNYYNQKHIKKNDELELPKGMAHGHLANDGNPLWFFFIQECGFKPDLKCAGDFHLVNVEDGTKGAE